MAPGAGRALVPTRRFGRGRGLRRPRPAPAPAAMRPALTALWLRLAVAVALAFGGPLATRRASARAPIYVSSWAVRVSQGYQEAERLARKFGFLNLGQIFPDGQYFHLRHRGVVQQSLTPHWGHRLRLKKDPKVQWFEQQTLRRRVKRSLAVPTDPWFSKQWYMNKEVKPDLNILQVWSQGLTGQGVVVSVLDDGIEKDHPDLWANYVRPQAARDPLASYDFNDYDPDPQPRYTPSDENRHGTRCAGEVAAIANNGFCGAGVAFNARIGGVRMLDGTITDVIEAQSLSLQPQHIHIYSASWGPEDDGRTVDGPGILTREAFRRGVTKGRGGLGTLFIWASGNGGLHYDNCNCDGYTNSIHTLSVGSTTQQGRVPWYSEACASTLTTTYSSGVATDPQIVTTDLHHQCTNKHTGTSASAPLAAGIIALALEANPFLTWRDMQHLVVRASRPAQLQAEDWRTNGVGRQGATGPGRGGGARPTGPVTAILLHSEPPLRLRAAGRRAAGGHGSHLGAHAAPEEMHCQRPAQPHAGRRRSPPRSPSPILPLMHVGNNVSACAGSHNYIRSLEHVQVQLSLSYSRRGDLEISLTSPMGTRSTLVAIRPLDISGQGYNNWIFMSTHFWDENPQGLWILGLENKGYYFNTGDQQRVCAAGHRGAVPGVPQLRLPSGPALRRLLPPEVLQPYAEGRDRGARAPSCARAEGVRQLPRVLLHLPRRLRARLHSLPAVLHARRALGLLLRARRPPRPPPAQCQRQRQRQRQRLLQPPPPPGPCRGARPAGRGRRGRVHGPAAVAGVPDAGVAPVTSCRLEPGVLGLGAWTRPHLAPVGTASGPCWTGLEGRDRPQRAPAGHCWWGQV
ncbi:proprotein convertase subtilisin/kexin type 4 isoform X4 [Lemur catta]|uniref:proprotein convertase subtilisin/kexin type 4 isoform X4 n=1 Tax=Lemur catta TaxID=9447 RepID=UPI001E26D752|nr:proprotein convertase subtilisin/kexin type 4 isoform X4 [Lemur catta]